jgi:metal-responsive CopG/Arc/MetJ family transcriptional regulator
MEFSEYIAVAKLIIMIVGPFIVAQSAVIWFAIRSYLSTNQKEHGEMKTMVGNITTQLNNHSLMVAGQYATRDEINSRFEKRDQRFEKIEAQINGLERRAG